MRFGYRIGVIATAAAVAAGMLGGVARADEDTVTFHAPYGGQTKTLGMNMRFGCTSGHLHGSVSDPRTGHLDLTGGEAHSAGACPTATSSGGTESWTVGAVPEELVGQTRAVIVEIGNLAIDLDESGLAGRGASVTMMIASGPHITLADVECVARVCHFAKRAGDTVTLAQDTVLSKDLVARFFFDASVEAGLGMARAHLSGILTSVKLAPAGTGTTTPLTRWTHIDPAPIVRHPIARVAAIFRPVVRPAPRRVEVPIHVAHQLANGPEVYGPVSVTPVAQRTPIRSVVGSGVGLALLLASLVVGFRKPREH